MNFIKKYIVYSEHSGNHIVSLTDTGEYACDCIGWIRHYPRIECKHIREVKYNNIQPIDKENWDALKGKKKKVKDTLDIFAKIGKMEQRFENR